MFLTSPKPGGYFYTPHDAKPSLYQWPSLPSVWLFQSSQVLRPVMVKEATVGRTRRETSSSSTWIFTSEASTNCRLVRSDPPHLLLPHETTFSYDLKFHSVCRVTKCANYGYQVAWDPVVYSEAWTRSVTNLHLSITTILQRYPDCTCLERYEFSFVSFFTLL